MENKALEALERLERKLPKTGEAGSYQVIVDIGTIRKALQEAYDKYATKLLKLMKETAPE